MRENKIICGAMPEATKVFPDGYFNCCISSPPYWALRDYGVDGQLGLEPTIEEYIEKLCDIYDEVKRVLRDDGTCWVNLGDTYSQPNSRRKTIDETEKNIERAKAKGYNVGAWGSSRGAAEGFDRGASKDFSDIPAKSLCLIPQRFAIEMVNRDTMDIYELDKGFIVCNNITVTENTTGVDYAIQRPNKSKRIQHEISQEVESRASRPISQTAERMAGKKQGQDKGVQPKVLRAKQRKGNNPSDEGKCKATPKAEAGSLDALWRESSKVCLLWGGDILVSDNRPHKQRWSKASKKDKKVRLDLRVVKENELSKRFQSFVYELQLGKREIWVLPPSRGQNLCLRKRDIPVELLPLFKLKKQERWLLRNVIIWHKPNPMPSSAKDRFTVDFEYVYFFVKSKKYWFEPQYEPHTRNWTGCGGNLAGKGIHKLNNGFSDVGDRTNMIPNPLGRNKRTVWTIPTQAYPDAHFATFPEKLVQPMIKAGCPEFVCTKCGKAREKIMEATGGTIGQDWNQHNIEHPDGRDPNKTQKVISAASNGTYKKTFKGYTDCGCGADWRPGRILDCFCRKLHNRQGSRQAA